MVQSTLFDRLFDKSAICENGCWEFTGYKNDFGYGRIKRDNGSLVYAHCAAYDLVVDDIPVGMKVLHSCDNPSCINPSHLFLGTQQDNIADMIAKGRDNFGHPGDSNAAAKLTSVDIQEIKIAIANGARLIDLGEQYNVHWKTISRIKNGNSWRCT